MPARFRQTSRALDHPHIDATSSYQTTKKQGYHYYHHSYQYQKEKGYKNKYEYNKYKYKYKAAKGPKDVPAAASMAQNSKISDSDSDGTREIDVSHDTKGSDKSKFGLRKVSNSQPKSQCRALLTINRDGTSTFSCPRTVPSAHRQASRNG